MKTTTLNTALLISITFTVLGCSTNTGNEIMYEMVKPNCSIKTYQTLSEMEQCQQKNENRMTYEEYKKERQKIIEGRKL